MPAHFPKIMCLAVLMTVVVHADGLAEGVVQQPPSLRDHHHLAVEDVVTLIGKKLFRGVANIATGWGEIPRQLILTTREDGPSLGLPLGLLKGIMMTGLRTAAGAAEVALFLVPAPGFYDPILAPGLVWERRPQHDVPPAAHQSSDDTGE